MKGEKIMEKTRRMVDLNGPYELFKKELSAEGQSEFCENGNSMFDGIQKLLLRWYENDDDRLYMNDQDHFNRLVLSIARKRFGRSEKLWNDAISNSEIIENIEIESNVNRKRVLNEKAVLEYLNEREKIALEFILSGKQVAKKVNGVYVATSALEKIGFTYRTFNRIKKTIIDKLKAANIKTDAITCDYRNDPIECHSLDTSDLRYRKAFNNDVLEKIEQSINAAMPVKESKGNGEKRTIIRKKPFLRITSPTVSKPTKKPDTVWYNLPSDINFEFHNVTRGKLLNRKAEHEAKVYSRSHVPEFFVESKRLHSACERPLKKTAFVNDDDYHNANPADIRIRYR